MSLLIPIKKTNALSVRINFVLFALRLINAINAWMSLYYSKINASVHLILSLITIRRNVLGSAIKHVIFVQIALIL